ncbi:MAG: hypothetical protein ACXW4E_11515, partial [Anaerolineales bacterium]
MKAKVGSTKYMIGLFLIAVMMATVAGPVARAQAAGATSTKQSSVIAWNAITIRTVITLGGQPIPAAFVYAAYVHAAVYNAVVA